MIPKPKFQTYRIIIDSLSSGVLPDGMSIPISIPEPIEKYRIPYIIASFVESALKTRILTPEERKQAWIEDKSSYDKGLADAWEAARKITCEVKYGGFTREEIQEIFGETYASDIMVKFTASEAIVKIKDYEEEQQKIEQEIKVGDEVFMDYAPNEAGIVTRIYPKGKIYIMWEDGALGRYDIINCKKTGRHFSQVEELLKVMKGE